jgi:hypothetical protein
MNRIVIRRGAGVNVVDIEGHTFDLNRMPPKNFHEFRREFVAKVSELKGLTS